jgi:hypothetical protein
MFHFTEMLTLQMRVKEDAGENISSCQDTVTGEYWRAL